MIDFVFVFADVGDMWHRTCCTEMLRSLRTVFPSATVVQLCDQDAKLHPWADAEWRANMKATKDNYPDFHAFVITNYACQATNPVIVSEIDGIWVPTDYQGDFPGGTKVRHFQHGAYVSFRDCPEKMIPFARSLDEGKPFTEMLPKTIMDLGHIKEVNAGDAEFGRLEIQPQT